MCNSSYKKYLLGTLMLVGVTSVFDRFIFALALEPMKLDLGLSDSQLGLMTGIAFSAFYAVAGIPLARWADRGNRVTISALSMGLLGIMLSLCGLVSNFFQLLLARAGVAVGEAGCMPVAQSLLADYFDRTERPRAMAIFFMFYPISMIIGYLVGGWMIGSLGWRTTFLILGIPGLLMAMLVKLTLKEPRATKKTKMEPAQPSLVEVFRVLWEKRTFRHVLLSFCVSSFFIMGTSQWLATFFIRTHGMGAIELGAWLALSWGVCGVLGNYLGGWAATRYATRKESLQLRALACVNIGYGLVSAVVYLSSNQQVALLFVAFSAIIGSSTNGPVFSVIQSLVVDRMRAVTIALVFLFSNLIGLGLGPLAIGIVSDWLSAAFGQESLRYALALFCPGVLWVAIHCWRAAKTVEDDIRLTESEQKMAPMKRLESRCSVA